MIGHNRVGAHAIGKHLGLHENPGPDPVSSMDEIPTDLYINATKKLAPHAPGDDPVVQCGVQRAQPVAGHRHSGLAHVVIENQPSGRSTDGL